MEFKNLAAIVLHLRERIEGKVKEIKSTMCHHCLKAVV